MKKFFTTLLAIIAISPFSYGQWSGGPTGNVYYNGGNVGIGTLSPTAISGFSGLTINHATTGSFLDLQLTGNTIGRLAAINAGLYLQNITNGPIVFSANGADRVKIDVNGNVGIGTTSPSAKLDVENGTALINTDVLAGLGGQVTISNGYGNQNGYVRLNLNNGGAVSWIKGIVTGPNTNTGSAMAFGVPSNTSDGAEVMRITSNGSLAIGTTDTRGYRLAVNGDAIATSMTVKLYSNWPDYVFEPAYKLPRLSLLKTYLDANHHLPEIPSAAEIEKNGLNLGEMNLKLLKKVEELTLYLIEKDRQITEQQKQNADQNKLLAEQQKINQSLQQQINQLAKKINN